MLSFLQSREIQPIHGGFTWGLGLGSVIVATIILVLRLWSRILNKSARFGGDDWMALAAWPFVIGQAFAIMFSFRWGVGNHVAFLDDEEYKKANQLALTILIMYCYNIAFIRISVSLYYKRIFAANTNFKRVVWLNIIVNLMWLVSIMFAAIFQCQNPQAMWTKGMTGVQCSPPIEHQHICSFSSVVLDLMVLLLPLPMVWKLQLKPAKKWEILAIFFIGYCVPVLTIGRLVSTMKTGDKLNQDPTWEFVNILYWLLLETTTAYVGVCLPSVLYLARRWRSSGFLSLFNRHAGLKSTAASNRNGTRPTLNSVSGQARKGDKHTPMGSIASSSDEELGYSNFAESKPQPHEDSFYWNNESSQSMNIIQTRSYSVTRHERAKS